MIDSVTALNEVTKKIKKAESKAGRNTDSVTLVAVSKTFDQDDIRPVLNHGQRIFGENRVQEAKNKWPDLRKEFSNITLHLIGPLQSNKAAEAIELFDVIETIDREKIAAELSKEIKKKGKSPRFYVQVNTGLEPQKAGVTPDETVAFVEHCRTKYELKIDGLMCIPPVGENPGPHFALLRKLARVANVEKLSMGMSSDYETAIEFGATSVRIGSAIFGHRDYNENQ